MSEDTVEKLLRILNIEDSKELFKIIAIYLLNKQFSLNTQQNEIKIFDIYKFDFNMDLFKKSLSTIDSYLSTVEINDDLLGTIYEKCLTKEFIKDYGLFYTRNNNITNNIIDNYITKLNYNSKVFEPASGSGLFLTQLIERLKAESFGRENLIHFVFNGIYFNDFDKFACFLTEYNILHSMIKELSEEFIINNNLSLRKLNAYNEDFSMIDISKLPKFDFILGNPPYVTLYGKMSRNMTNEKRIYYNSRYKFITDNKKNNKFNLIMFFLENSMDLLKENGVCSFIIDISFFETAYNDIRKYLLENYNILNIHSNIKAWDNVASAQIILTLEKSYNKNNIVKWYVGEDLIEIPQSSWLHDNKITLPPNNITQIIIKNITNKTSVKLGDFLDEKKLRTCCALTGRTEDFIREEQEYIIDNENIFKYLEGSKSLSGKFGNLKHTSYIAMDYSLQEKISNEFKVELEKLGVKNKKRVTLGNKKAYQSPKIFIRQSAHELISTYTEDVFAANNSIYIGTFFSDTIEAKIKLKYLNAYLNSELATFLALQKNIIRRGIGKTPQIKISDLKTLPIIDDTILINELSKITDNPTFENIEILNNKIYAYFNLSEKEITFIKENI